MFYSFFENQQVSIFSQRIQKIDAYRFEIYFYNNPFFFYSFARDQQVSVVM